MASVLVYVQRTPHGLHPASEVALSVARDIGTVRGATVMALAAGDGGAFDERVEQRCGALGADQLVLVGPDGLKNLASRLQPKHVLAGWTREAIRAVGNAGLGPLEPRWVDGPPPLETLPPFVGVVAGALPWHAGLGPIDAEYEGDVDQVPVAPWLSQGDGSVERSGGLVYVAPDGLEGPIPEALERLGAHAVPAEYAANHRKGTLLWLSADGQGLPVDLADRPASARVIALPGPAPTLHDTWNLADWVLSGPWGKVLSTLESPNWQAAIR